MFQNKSLFTDSFGLKRQELNFVVNNFAAERALNVQTFTQAKKKSKKKRKVGFVRG